MFNFSKWTTSDIIQLLAFLVVLTSLLSPVFTAYLNKKIELKLKMLEIYKENHNKNYNRILYTFQNFIEESGKIIASLDSEHSPTNKEIQRFESACLKCLIFLDEAERKEFDDFRITIKKKLGVSDPRGYYHPFSARYMTKVMQKAASSLYSTNKINVEKSYISFNKCIMITNRKLSELQLMQKEELNEVKGKYLLLKISKASLRGLQSIIRKVKTITKRFLLKKLNSKSQ